MRSRLKSVGIALALVSSGACCFADTARGALSPPTLIGQVPMLAQAAIADQKATGDRFYKQGEEQLNQEQLTPALESLQKALEIYRRIQDRKQEGRTLRLIGNVFAAQKNYIKTIEFQQQALAVARTIQDADLEARALNNIGLAYANLKQPDKARSYYEQSLDTSTRSKNFRMIATTVGNLSILMNDAKDYAKSRAVLQDALSRIPEGVDKARLLWNLGNVYLLEAYENLETRTTEQILRDRTIPSPLYKKAINIYQQALLTLRFYPDPQLRGEILSTLATVYMNIGDFPHSIELSKQALALFKQALNQPKQLSEMMQLMRYYSLLSASAKDSKDYQQGIEASNQVFALASETLTLAKALNQPNDEREVFYIQVSAYFLKSNMYLKLQNLSEAKKYADRAWELAQQWNDPKMKNNALTALEGYYTRIGYYAKLVEVRQRALEMAQINSNPYEKASTLSSLSSSYGLLGNPQKELQLLQDANAKAKQITSENLPPYATTEMVISLKHGIAMGFTTFYKRQGDSTQELAFAQQTLELSRMLSNRVREVEALLRVASAYRSGQNYKIAYQSTQEALTLAKTLKQLELEIEALTDLSQVAVNQGEPKNALEHAQQALNTVQRYKPKSPNYDWVELELKALGALSNAYQSQGSFAKALEALQQSVAVSEQSANTSDQQNARQSLGVFYLGLGDYTNATAQFQQMLALAQAQQYPLYQQGALSFLSQVAFAQQKPQQAIELAQQGLNISRQMQFPGGELSNMQALSRGYGELGDDPKAIAMAQDTLHLARKMEYVWHERSALETLGNLHRRFGRLDQAQASYEAALASGSRSASTYAGLAQVYVQRNQPTAAIAFYKQAINNIEAYRRNLRGLSTDLQQSFLQSTLDFGGVKTADIYRQLADLLISQNRILEAQQILELLRVEEIKDATQPLRGNQKPDNIALSPLEQELARKHGSLIAFGRDVEQCRDAKPQPCAQLPQLLKQLTQLNSQFNTFIGQYDAEIRQNTANDRAAVDPTQLDYAQRLIETTQQKTQKNAILVYPLVLDKRLWIIWVSSAGVQKSQPVPVSQLELAKTVIEFRRLMQACERRTCNTQDTIKLQAVSQQLYDWLIRPIEPELRKNKVENLIFALDRIVRYIPMAALHDGNQYLIQKYTVSTVLSASLTQIGDRAPFTPNQTQILGLGVSQPVSNLTVAGSRYNFTGLPYVPVELGSIIRGKPSDTQGIFPGEERLNNFDANTLVTELYKRKHRILHLATHGKFVAGNPLASFLLLGNGQPFTVADIQNLTALDFIDLIVLSACESALGGAEGGISNPSQLDGIEISSMSYHFLNKRTKTVLASLWQVNDPSTALLMQQFYKYLAAGKTKVQALQEAQRDLLSKRVNMGHSSTRADVDVRVEGRPTNQKTFPDFSHPYYWAPFILIGNGL